MAEATAQQRGLDSFLTRNLTIHEIKVDKLLNTWMNDGINRKIF